MPKRDFHNDSLLRIFLSYFRPHMGLFLTDMACALMISLIDLAFPFISRLCMYELIPENRYQAFFAVIAVMIAAYLLRAGLQYIVCYWGHAFGVLVEADIRKDLFSHLQTLSFGFYDKNRTGHLMSRMTAELFDITELAHHGPEDLFISGVTLVGAIIIMFTIQWRLALVMLILIPVFLVVVSLNRRNMAQAAKRVKQVTAGINADIESSISGIRTAKAFSNENAESEKFEKANERFKTSKKERYKAMSKFFASLEFFMCIMPMTVIAVGGLLIMDGQMNYIDLTTFCLYTSTFINPMRKVSTLSELLVDGIAGLSRFVDLMRIEPELTDRPGAVDLRDVKGSIDVENVSFAYERDDTEVLHQVNLHVRPGETIAIVGPSGGGRPLCAASSRGFTTCWRAASKSTVWMCGTCGSRASTGMWALSSRTCSSLPPALWRISDTGVRTPRQTRSWTPPGGRKSTTISCPCPTALTPTWASGACSSPADRSSAFPLPGFATRTRRC